MAPLTTRRTVTAPSSRRVSYLNISDSAKYGDYTLRLRSDGGEVAFLAGALTLDPNTDIVELNPLENNNFFVRRQYLDFLFREPDAEGNASWLRVLNGSVNNTPDCDSTIVSQSFLSEH